MGEFRQQQIFKIRRDYNSWVANETLEDYALRFAPRSFRKWSAFRVANTAFGSIAFLVLEAIGGALTITYGFTNAFWAIVSVGLVIFLTGFPLAYYAARHNIDMDLLTRGAGFGYIGSTLTSLIYASFTFTLFALEASIMSLALQMYFGWPIAFCHIVSAVVIIPLVMYGITNINRLQLWTQPVWLILLAVPFVAIFMQERDALPALLAYTGVNDERGFSWLAFGAASTVAFAMIAQIGEQIDFLRFMPEKTKENRVRWWSAVVIAGPGWIVFGVIRQLMGAFLAFLAIKAGVSASHAFEPTQMYLMAYGTVFEGWGERGILLATTATLLLVVISQIKINVTNAYAGSLAWSNFFSRLTHSHPGRVVWLIFNVAIALLLMELGVFGALERVLGLFSNIAIAWIGALVADLVINKPLKLSPPFVEFKRAYLPDINPVGVFSTLIASGLSIAAYLGLFGIVLQAFSAYLALCVAFVLAPLIAWFTRNRGRAVDVGQHPAHRYTFPSYIARDRHHPTVTDPCCICGNTFEAEDNAYCPAYSGNICSLCCTLDARCRDACKPGYRLDDQLQRLADLCMPGKLGPQLRLRLMQFTLLYLLLATMSGIFLGVIYFQDLLALGSSDDITAQLLTNNFTKVYACLLIFIGLASWWLILNNESRQVAQEESNRQTGLLLKEIDDHRNTDAELQRAREAADNANRAKSRFLTDMSHEVRTPLNSILGYAQLLTKDPKIPPHRRDAVATIQNSGEHLAQLIDDILDIARIEARKFEMKREPIDVPALVEQMVKMFRPQAEGNGLAFRCQIRSRLPHFVRGDQNRLRQILINLLANAVKFTSTGEVVLQVDYSGQVIVFRVSDTGEGIPADQLDEIFQPFRRLNVNRGNAVAGSGLGLTICKILAEVMGGELKVESTIGSGTTFMLRLFLPELHDVASAPQSVVAGDSDEREIIGYHGMRRRILVVDDQQQHRELLCSVLAPLGFELIEASSGHDGYTRALEQRPQLILTDLDMGDGNGNELVRQLRRAGFSASMIVISAHAYQNHRADAIAAGADDFMAKPFQIDDLLTKIRLHLSLEWIRADEESQPMPPVSDSAPIRFPDGDTLRELAQLARIGDLRGVTEQLQQLADQQPDYAPFAAHLQGLAKEFRLADIKRLLSEE